MSISKKLQDWVNQGLITAEQADKICAIEQNKRSNVTWLSMFAVSGLLIGLGLILLVGANWDVISGFGKIIGDFVIWSMLIFGISAVWDMNKKIWKELLLVISFLFVGASIGLLGQIFNLEGGWQNFALAWTLLGAPYVLSSRVKTLNVIWLCILLSGINFNNRLLDAIFEFFDKAPMLALVSMTMFFGMLNYIGKQLAERYDKILVLPEAVSKVSAFIMYYVALLGGASVSLDATYTVSAHLFVFAFLGICLLVSLSNKNMTLFIRQVHLVELYVLFVFFSCFGDLLMTGIGFIVGGVLLLGFLFLLKRTSKYIKKMEIFK